MVKKGLASDGGAFCYVNFYHINTLRGTGFVYMHLHLFYGHMISDFISLCYSKGCRQIREKDNYSIRCRKGRVFMEKNQNRINMVVFDWAGTTVDYGSSAPMDVFQMVFEEAGIRLTRNEINGPMGMEKKAHFRSLLSLETAIAQWREKYGRDWTDEDVENLYVKFEEKLYDVVASYSTPIDGVVETVKRLKESGLKIGSTTGYNNQIMTKVAPAAKEQGYEPDCIVTPDITGAGRPTPFMLNECMRVLNVYPPRTVVKVGDTITDIYEGKNAGAWSIGILVGSNLLGLTKTEFEKKSELELEVLKDITRKRYMAAGADMVIDNITELPAAIEKINKRLANEE